MTLVYSTSFLWQSITILAGVSFVAYMYHKNVKDIRNELILAALISAAWVFFSGFYNYKDSNYIFLGLNLFTFTAWTSGLVAIKEIYEWIPSKKRFLIASALYISLVMIFEFIGYNYWLIQRAADDTGLFGLSLMHMPWWGKLYYLTIGIVFLWVTDLLRIK